MTNAENAKKYSLIAAICFAVVTAYDVYLVIPDIRYYLENGFLLFLHILSWATAIGFAVTLFLENKFAVTIVSGIYALLRVYYIVRYFSLYDLLDLLAIAAVVVILVLSLKNNQITKKIWFIGAALLFVGTLISWITRGFFSAIPANQQYVWKSYVWKSMFFDLVEIMAFLFVGLWAKESIAASGEAAPVNEYATFDPQKYSNQTASNDAIGGADKLKMYKELLDSGTITKEEFDAMKKQILDL